MTPVLAWRRSRSVTSYDPEVGRLAGEVCRLLAELGIFAELMNGLVRSPLPFVGEGFRTPEPARGVFVSERDR